MSRPLSIALAQAAPRQVGEPISNPAREVEELAGRFPGVRLAVLPELRPLYRGRAASSLWAPARG
ncbi:hypothetical protein ACSDR0_19785 [Streptosporangium sp. G11]|uniref:hypothetical protein n=1 Tax=Streptosporangium sp. G11 TaxID=3436926 RepID=UPI003EC01322